MKKLDIKPIIISILLIIFQSILYILSSCISGHNAVLIGSNIDNLIPFRVEFIVFYSFWYILVLVMPYYYYKKDKDTLTKYILCYIIMSIVANIIFCFYPTTVARPQVLPHDLFSSMAYIVFSIDANPINCFPSLHCAMSMIWIILTLKMKKSDIRFKWFILVISTLIMVSTLYVKQHVIIDVISGIIISSIVVILVNYSKRLIKNTKNLLKL